ncbi:hypothetical protein [Paenibacillus pseudetheri]|uniref:Uncharacterized protein n=1 Tax=Paenibacillus pseudetheri TaxID=2897682 RepID=A0ABN8FGH5_9BACL|nr:hypothetical protein [Paenibacillus pseudetheri]CAH1054633.1 hypothetical protein PAECIP111894_00778 [Paenibacillus pseudetheri]
MNDKQARLFRIEQLKKRIKIEIPSGSLYSECIEALGPNTRVYSSEKSSEIVSLMEKMVNFTLWARIDWESIDQKRSLKKPEELKDIEPILLRDNYFVVWNEFSLPIVETNLDNIIKNFNDVIAVGFDTWIVNLDKGIFIESHHEGDLTMGWITT